MIRDRDPILVGMTVVGEMIVEDADGRYMWCTLESGFDWFLRCTLMLAIFYDPQQVLRGNS